MNQKKNILASNAPVIKIGDTKYKGKNPVFIPITNDLGQVTGYEKIQKGVPFVRVDEIKH